MKRFTNMVWAAVAVLGLYSPVFSYAGPFGNYVSKGGMVQSNQSSSSNSSNSNGNSFKSMPYKGGLSGQVLNQNLGGKLGKGPILVGNNLPPAPKTPGKPFPGNVIPIIDPVFGSGGKKPPILDPGKGNGGIVPPFPGGMPPIIDPNGGGKGPKKPPIFDPGKIPPIFDPGNGGGKPPKKPPIFDPGKIPPIFDPGNGGGKNPPGGGNNPPGGGNNPPGGGNNPPGGGNGGGNGNGNGNGNCHHGGGKFCWPNYCLNWWWPAYYTQPYCGTVFVNGCWTYVTQPVVYEQISLVEVGETLPEIPSNATFKLPVSGLGPMKGLAAVEINGVGMQAELLEWSGDAVVVRLPAVGLTQPLVSELHILQSDGSMAKTLRFKMLPALQNAVAVN